MRRQYRLPHRLNNRLDDVEINEINNMSKDDLKTWLNDHGIIKGYCCANKPFLVNLVIKYSALLTFDYPSINVKDLIEELCPTRREILNVCWPSIQHQILSRPVVRQLFSRKPLPPSIL